MGELGLLANHSADEDQRPPKGLWLSDIDAILKDEGPRHDLIESLLKTITTDVYLRLKPHMYDKSSDGLQEFVAKLTTIEVRVWATHSTKGFLDTAPLGDEYIAGLCRLGDYNDTARPEGRFHGLLVYAETSEIPLDSGIVLDPQEHVEHEVVLHRLLNLVTRASNLMHSYEMPIALAIPPWLVRKDGRLATGSWSGDPNERTTAVDLLRPLVDEVVVVGDDPETESIPAAVLGGKSLDVVSVEDSLDRKDDRAVCEAEEVLVKLMDRMT